MTNPLVTALLDSLTDADLTEIAAALRPYLEHEPPAEWLSAAAAADYISVRPARIYELCSRGDLRHERVGERTIRIRRSDIDAYLESRATGGPKE